MNIFKVRLSKQALRDIKKLPSHIVIKLHAWVDEVGTFGLSHVKRTPGYHDEPLQGQRKGQRSIRLSRSYRAIYHIDHDRAIRFVHIIGVNKHDY